MLDKNLPPPDLFQTAHPDTHFLLLLYPPPPIHVLALARGVAWHGGLDDYHFLPFLRCSGQCSGQLMGPGFIRLRAIHDARLWGSAVRIECLVCVGFVNSMKAG